MAILRSKKLRDLFSAGLVLTFLLSFPGFGHIVADSGRTLQLLSFKMAGTAPTIDGDVATANPREWQEAYNRRVVLTSDGDATTNDSATLLLMNDDNYLYVALAYDYNNTGATNQVSFYFDEGAAGGSHDDVLSAGHENGAIFRIGTDASRQDLYWNGTAWVVDADAANDFNSGWAFSALIHNLEMRIPLNNSKTDNSTNSDLDVSATNEIGFFFKIFKPGMGGGTTVYWDRFPGTSENTVANYADIQLGVQRTYSTLYATYKALPAAPSLTNAITGDDAWRGCYQRAIVLTNFMGSILRGTMYLVDDPATNFTYAGIKITDESNSADYIRLYQEQKPTTNNTYDALLDDNAENCLELTAGGTFADKYFNQAVSNDVPGTWENDPEAADNNAGHAAYNATNVQHEFELRIDRNAGAYDLTLNDNANCQFLIEYYDADAPAGERLYYWSNSTNNVQVTADQTNTPPNRVALGYGVLQLGAPYCQVISPEDGSNVEGVVHVRAYVEKTGSATADSVKFYRASASGTKYAMTRIASTFEWTGTYDVTSLASNTSDTLVIQAYDGTLMMERLVVVTVANDSGSAEYPSISITSPAAGALLSGQQTIAFTAGIGGGYTITASEISIDGGAFGATTAAASHTWTTTPLNDGSHTVQIRATGSNGMSAVSATVIYITANAPTVTVSAPAAGQAVSGNLIFQYSASAKATAIITADSLSLDGGAWTAVNLPGTDTLDTQPLSDGTHSMQIKTTDSYGKNGLSPIVMFKVSNSPSIAITAPRADSVVAGTLVVLFTATPVAPATIASTQISVDGGAWRATSTSTTDTLNTQALTEGSHTIQIRATDNNGKVGTSAIVKFAVQNLPAIVITAPRADSVVSGTHVVLFTATPVAPATIASTQISVDGGAWRATSTNTTDTLNTQSLTEGSHTIQVRATDNNGKVGTSAIVKFVVQNLPAIAITSPRADSVVSGTHVVLFTATPVAPATITSTQISVDGGAWRATSTVSTDTLNTQSLTEGSHTIQVRATDNNGKTGLSPVVKIVVSNNPTVVVTAPRADSVVSGTLTVQFTATPVAPATIASTQISVDGGSWRATSTALTDTINTTILTEGAHIVLVRAIDNNGKTGMSRTVKFVINNLPTIVITVPAADSVVSGTLVARFIATVRQPATLASTLIAIDGGTWSATDTDSSDTIDTRSLSDGAHNMQARIIDNTGKSTDSRIVGFTIRNAPSVTLTSPRADSTLSGTATIAFTATPIAPATIARREIYIDGAFLDTATTATSHIWNTLVLTDGNHTVQVRVFDSEGKTSVSQTVMVAVRNTPVVLVTAPAESLVVSGIDTVKFTVQYAPGASRDTTEISFDGGPWIATTGDLSHVWRTTDFLDGNHMFQVRATGTNGKTGYSQIRNIMVKNLPTVALLAPTAGEVLSGIDTVRFTVTPVSPATIVRREISIDGGTWTTVGVGNDSCLITTTNLTDGTHSVQIRGVDDHGRTGYSQQLLFITDNRPTVALELPAAGDTLANTITVRFTAMAVDPAVIAMRLMQVDGGAFDTLDNTATTASINSHLLADGSHTVTIVVKDDSRRIASTEQRLFVVDNTEPVTADPLVVYPREAYSARSGADVLVTVLVRDIIAGLATDSSVVLSSSKIDTVPATYVMRDDGQGGDKVANDNVYSALVAVRASVSDTIGYSVRSRDRLGNEITLNSAIHLDNTAPETFFTIDPSPKAVTAGLALYTDRVVLKGRYSDAGGSGLSRVSLSIVNDTGKHVESSPIELSPADSLFSRVVTLVRGANTLMLHAVDRAGNTDSAVIAVTVYDYKATAQIDRAGGTVKSDDGAMVVVPPDALLSDREITIVRVDPIDQPKPLDASVKLLNVCRNFGPEGLTFRKPVTLTLTYNEADLDKDQNNKRDIDPLKLAVVFWDGKTWRTAGVSSVDTVQRKVTVSVNHFTMYDLAEVTAAVPEKVVAYWTANPVKSGSGSYFMYGVPARGTVSLRILDMAGHVVREMIPDKSTAEPANQLYSVAWNGWNVSDRFAGAGLYIYIFKYQNDATKATTIIRKPVGLLR